MLSQNMVARGVTYTHRVIINLYCLLQIENAVWHIGLTQGLEGMKVLHWLERITLCAQSPNCIARQQKVY